MSIVPVYVGTSSLSWNGAPTLENIQVPSVLSFFSPKKLVVRAPSLSYPLTLRDSRSQTRINHYVHESRWGRPCEAMFEELATNDPSMLIDMTRIYSLEPTDLVYAAISLGEIQHSDAVIPLLRELLCHPKAYVREGAIYGLSKHLHNSTAISMLREHQNVEENEDVKEVLSEILEELDAVNAFAHD
jgi:hypothetical protein